VILPHENEPDLEELPKETRREMEFVLADSIDQVLAVAFNGVPRPVATAPAADDRRKAAASPA
jgi:ATP-dependent Lon protease